MGPAAWAHRHPERVNAQVMELGTSGDVQHLRQVLGHQRLGEVLTQEQRILPTVYAVG